MATDRHEEVPYFISLGMFIIDEIDFPGLRLSDILGGGGTFAICGSRIVLDSKESHRCAWVVDIGNDCPADILKALHSWNTGGIFRYDGTRKCTRGWNGYGPNEFRDFKYLTPKKRITVSDLELHPYMLRSKSFHLICSPERCEQVLNELDEMTTKFGIHTNSVIAWEPIPDFCNPENLKETLEILSKIDILTPNSAECAAYFGRSEPRDFKGCEDIAKKFIKWMTKPQSGIVLRCGSMGCLLIKLSDGIPIWFPAYYSKNEDGTNNSKVIDPTGCGNTFVGAFATEFVKSGKNFERACIFATIASGACIEQHGTPTLTVSSDGTDLWNGLSFNDRLQKYIEKYSMMKEYI